MSLQSSIEKKSQSFLGLRSHKFQDILSFFSMLMSNQNIMGGEGADHNVNVILMSIRIALWDNSLVIFLPCFIKKISQKYLGQFIISYGSKNRNY